MKRKIVFICLVPVLLLWGTGMLNGAEKVGTTSFQFLKLAYDVRASAMGGEFVSVANTSAAMFSNPGGLAFLQNMDLSFSYTDYFVDVGISAFTIAMPLGNLGTFGFNGLILDYGTIEVTEISAQGWNQDFTYFNPGLTGETINPGAMAFGISYARALTNKFNFGLTVRYASEDLVREKVSALLFDAGLIYQTGFRSVQFGAAIRNFGPEVTFINESYPLPQTFLFGTSMYLLGPENAILGHSGWQSLLVLYNLIHPRDYDQQHSVGAEYNLHNLLFIRAGYKFNYDEEGLTFGGGLQFKGIRFDYAYEPFGEVLDPVHQFSVGYGLK